MNWNRGVSKSRLSAYLAFPLGVALGLLILSVPLLAHHGAAQFDNEDTCHEGNVDLAHLKNTYEQAHGSAAHPTTNPAKLHALRSAHLSPAAASLMMLAVTSLPGKAAEVERLRLRSGGHAGGLGSQVAGALLITAR